MAYGRDEIRLEEITREIHSIHAINQLAVELREKIYKQLIPKKLFNMFSINPHTLTNKEGDRVANFITPRQAGFAIIELREHPDDQDCIFFLEIADTPFSKIEITFLIVNDPRSPRFNTDIDEYGRRTKFGTARRNIPEEIKAMEYGLAPGQVRKGLGVLKDFIPSALGFLASMGHDMVLAEPLAYHNAIIFEHYGFNYMRGRKKMEEIHREFQPGGELFKKLDGSTPFRQPGQEKTVRGRSWAIHDGILGEPWRDVEMYRSVNRHAEVCTFPGWVY
jgi:hypothetical protein